MWTNNVTLIERVSFIFHASSQGVMMRDTYLLVWEIWKGQTGSIYINDRWRRGKYWWSKYTHKVDYEKIDPYLKPTHLHYFHRYEYVFMIFIGWDDERKCNFDKRNIWKMRQEVCIFRVAEGREIILMK